jgi:AcrR family transcriptional regulator
LASSSGEWLDTELSFCDDLSRCSNLFCEEDRVAQARRRKVRAPAPRGEATKERIVEAAIETLKREGFAGASARALAEVGSFNQALVFYHFGSVNRLLLAALDRTSEMRMQRYREMVEAATDLPSLLVSAAAMYREDLESEHIKVMAEMIAGASSEPDLGPEIVRRIEPWIAFAKDAVDRVAAMSPLGALVPSEDAAYAIVALYLGIELLTNLDENRSRADRLFATANSIAAMFGPLFSAGAPSERTL